MGSYWKLFFFLNITSSERGQIFEGIGSLGWGGKVCRIDKSRNYTWCKESTASYFCWLLLESLLASAACFLASNSSLLRTYQVGQIYCYKTWRQITPEMFIALQGKSQFKIKVIQIVVCGMLTCQELCCHTDSWSFYKSTFLKYFRFSRFLKNTLCM